MDPTRTTPPVIMLVCRVCRKRKNGPLGPKAKDIALQLRRSAKARGVKARVLLTSCQGVCPKGATSVMAFGGGARAEQFDLVSEQDIERVTAGTPVPSG